ncbi:MAG: CbbQ/NirQ/NorQ C-terminal domain-containing protein, partial [Nitrosomonadales bacterium]|nr:CbbQ/NirQ/NorQ C-terminal domain-containing protein [Nitrosomonadales bacterium]
SYNPGYQNFLKGMKPSTRQRFVSLTFDFPDPILEEEILIGETAIDAMTAKHLVSIACAFRALRDHDLEEVASTRLLIYAAILIKDGCEPSLACKSAMVETLTDDPDTTTALMEVIYATFGR